MIGESAAMARVLELIARVARSDATVLVRGESGTGKELAARAVHRSSPRAEAPFVAINCAALSQTLLESELFGHEKGSFTGAVARKIGKLEAADGGTLEDGLDLLPALGAHRLSSRSNHSRAVRHSRLTVIGEMGQDQRVNCDDHRRALAYR